MFVYLNVIGLVSSSNIVPFSLVPLSEKFPKVDLYSTQ